MSNPFPGESSALHGLSSQTAHEDQRKKTPEGVLSKAEFVNSNDSSPLLRMGWSGLQRAFDRTCERSEIADRFFTGTRSQGAERRHVDVFADEADRAVDHAELGTPFVATGEGLAVGPG